MEMNSNVLTLAKQYQKQHKWQKAVECFEQYMRENNGCTDEVYASYARCLRLIGQIDHANKILNEGCSLYPQNEKILTEFFRLYDHLGYWEEAKFAANDLTEINPQNGEHYLKLGRANSWLLNKKQAEQAYKKGLEYKHGLSFEALKEKIQRGFTKDLSKVTTEYIYINGKNNLGAFIHHYQGKKFITKISKTTQSVRREKTFYRNVLTRFPSLKEITPLYIDSQTFDQVQYLTIEMVDGAMPAKTLEEINDVSQQISSITYQEIMHHYSNPDYSFLFKSRPSSIGVFFTKIHQKYYNQKLLSTLKELTRRRNYSKRAAQVLDRLESLIIDNHLYVFIEPDRHYSLLHGDFISANMKETKQGNVVKVFDWASFKVGPRFMDMARYVMKAAVPYNEVREMSLLNTESDKGLSLIEQIFFLYSYILLNFVALKDKNKHPDEILSEFIIPALTDMEAKVSQFKQEEFGTSVQLILDNEMSVTQQNKELREKLAKLETEKSKVQSKLHNVLSSKSWKITAPLRRIMEKRRTNHTKNR